MYHFRFLALAVLLVLASPFASATPTNTLTTGGYYSGYDNNFSSGMVSFTFNGVQENGAAGNIAGSSAVIKGVSTVLSELFCVDLPDTIYLNTTYTASFDTTGSVKGVAVNDAGQIAWLLLNLSQTTTNADQNVALQAAIWQEEYGSAFILSGNNDPTILAEYNADLNAVGAISPAVLAADIADVEWITPLNGDGSNAQAQVALSPGLGFGQESPAVTPEPGSLVLLSTGIFGIAGAVRRRFKA